MGAAMTAPDRAAVLAKVRAAIRSVAGEQLAVRADDQLVDDLGFDSAAIASLTIALEDVFDEVLLLSDWIADAGRPSDLTVGSLVDHVLALLADGD
jgi:acyl carrier protein